MARFEYKSVPIHLTGYEDIRLAEELNKHGQDEWRLLEVIVPQDFPFVHNCVHCLFARQVVDAGAKPAKAVAGKDA